MSDDPIFGLDKAAGEDEIAFDYIKGPDFRVIWVDGVVGGVTPRGQIHFAAYAERQAIPRRQVFKVRKTSETLGQLGEEVPQKMVSRGSVVREMTADLLMTPDTAEAIAKWLMDRVKEIREQKTGEN